MARKKSASKQENPEAVSAQPENAEETPRPDGAEQIVQAETPDITGTEQHNPQAETIKSDSDYSDQRIADDAPQTADNAGSQPHDDQGECGKNSMTTGENDVQDNGGTVLPTTGEIDIDDASFSDDYVMNRLRNSLLTSSELYREAQIFAAQNLNVPSMLRSGEPNLVQNTLEILRITGTWQMQALDLLDSEDQRTRELSEGYLLHAIREHLVPTVDVIDDIIEKYRTAKKEENGRYLETLIEKIRPILLNLIAQKTGDIESLQTALTHLCTCLDIQTVERMTYDPDPDIRTAIIRSLHSRNDIDLNLLSLVLILLKDRCEQVNIAVMKLCERLCIYPELVVPQILPVLPNAGNELRSAILDVFRAYADAAVEPLMTALEDTSDAMFNAVSAVIASAPQRYTSALLKAFQSTRTRDYVKDRIAAILSGHRDPTYANEIRLALQMYEAPAQPKYPQWMPPKSRQVMFAEKATDNNDFYTRLLNEDEIREFSDSCSEDVLLRLMADASEFAQINALNVIAGRGQASAVAKENIAVWMKSSSQPLAESAINAWFSVHDNFDTLIPEIVEALSRNESPDIQKYLLSRIADLQPASNAMIRFFFEQPRRCIHIISYILQHNATPETVQNLLHGIDRSQSVACIAETMHCLEKHKHLQYDHHALYKDLLAHIREPVSFGQFGLNVRLRSIALLKRFLQEDGEPDRMVISELQALYKDSKNFEIKAKIKDLLKAVGEEIFDFDDEDDDFEDLCDDDEL